MKFTAGIVLRNEAHSIIQSIESILPYVDEVIVVEDNSIDESREIVKKMAESNSKIILKSCGKLSRLADARNHIDDIARGDWIIWWDADFIAYSIDDSPDKSFGNLIDFIENNEGLNQILYGGPNFGPVYGKTLSNKPYQGTLGDTQITRKGFMRFKVGEYIDTRYYTDAQKTGYLNLPSQTNHFVHLDKVKPILRLILRDFLYEFEVDSPEVESTPENFKEWLYKKRPNFNLKGAINYTLNMMSEMLIGCDYGPPPKILHDFEPFSWYKVSNNKIIYVAPENVDDPYKAFFD